MSQKSLFDKVWESHTVRILPNGQTQLFIDTHLLHEVTSPQAFGMLRDLGLPVRYPERTFATVDHIVPTNAAQRVEPFADELAVAMLNELRKNCADNHIRFFDIPTGGQGVIHIVGPEEGITQPGRTITCGDSHTATHGAFGALAFGIGTSQVRDVLATQTLSFAKPKLRRVQVDGKLAHGVYPKDVVLHLIRKMGVNGGLGFAHEYAGEVFDDMDMEGRMTVCNMAIEGGARFGYVNPDRKTAEYLKGRPYAPKAGEWDAAVARWLSFASDPGCAYDEVVKFRAEDIAPTVTWGLNPAQAIAVDEKLPLIESLPACERASAEEAFTHMQLTPGGSLLGTKVDVTFLGSCTNGRLTDLREAAKYVAGKKVAKHVQAIVVPGSQIVAKQAREEGIEQIFRDAGFEWREAGCSMCLGMNPDKLVGDQLCASSSNRNFKGRMGSPTGRTMLMSPVMVAAAALTGEIADARKVFGIR